MSPRKNLLIIEDHVCVRTLLCHVLGNKFDVVAKEDGLEGMAYLCNGNLPDLILLDISMPTISGIELLSNLRSSGFFRHIPVVILSANDDPRERQRCTELGISGFYQKPFNPLSLHQHVESIFDALDDPKQMRA